MTLVLIMVLISDSEDVVDECLEFVIDVDALVVAGTVLLMGGTCFMASVLFDTDVHDFMAKMYVVRK